MSLDSGCNSKTTTGNIVRLFVEDKVDAFIGPPCSQGLNECNIDVKRPPEEVLNYSYSRILV